MNIFLMADHQKMTRFLIYGCFMLLMLFTAACDSGNNSSATSDNDIGEPLSSVVFQVEWPESPSEVAARDSRSTNICQEKGIAEIKAVVYDTEKEIISADRSWPCSDGSGTLDIQQIPENGEGILVLLAMDSEDKVLYRGQAKIGIEPGKISDAGTVSLSPFVPVLTSKKDSPYIQWDKVDAAEGYRIQALKDGNLVTMDARLPKEEPLQYEVSSKSRRYRVCAIDVYENESAWSVMSGMESYFLVPENSKAGTEVGVLNVAAEGGLTYAITGGTGQELFAVDEGRITVADGAALDYETKAEYDLSIEIKDQKDNLKSRSEITVAVKDVNESPDIPLQSFSLNENSEAGKEVGTVKASDADAGDRLSYEIVGGTGKNVFDIHPKSGKITVAASSETDYETLSEYTLHVQVTDSENLKVVQNDIKIFIKDINESPIPEPGEMKIGENSSPGAVVGKVEAKDTDAEDILSYLLVGGTGKDLFKVDSTTGEIKVAEGAKLNFEDTKEYTLEVQISDAAGLAEKITVTIRLDDSNEQPDIQAQKFSVDENSPAGKVVGTVTADDPDGDDLTYSIVGGTGKDLFEIDLSMGLITVAQEAVLNYETMPEDTKFYTLEVKVEDNKEKNLSDQAEIKIVINDANDPPEAKIIMEHISVATDTKVGQIRLDGSKSSDPDKDELTYQWGIVPTGSCCATAVTEDLADPRAAQTFLFVKGERDYEISLVVSDGKVQSEADKIIVSTYKPWPNASDDMDRVWTPEGIEIKLDGSGSIDANNNPLTYQWSFVSKPEDSNAAFDNPNLVKPKFTADRVQTYPFGIYGVFIAKLVVKNEVWENSDEVMIRVYIPIDFPDKNLDTAVREAIVKPEGNIKPWDLERFYILNAAEKKIENLEGLQYCADMKELDLSGNRISDISPLLENAGFGQGDEINLKGNPLDEDSCTEHIPSLKSKGVTVHHDCHALDWFEGTWRGTWKRSNGDSEKTSVTIDESEWKMIAIEDKDASKDASDDSCLLQRGKRVDREWNITAHGYTTLTVADEDGNTATYSIATDENHIRRSDAEGEHDLYKVVPTTGTDRFAGFYCIEYEGVGNTGKFTLNIAFDGKAVIEDYIWDSGMDLVILNKLEGTTDASGGLRLAETSEDRMGIEFFVQKIDDSGNISGWWHYRGELPNYGEFSGTRR